MKKKVSALSIMSMVISIIAAGMFLCMLGDTGNFFYYPWGFLGPISIVFPIAAKYYRNRNNKAGKGFEITALVIGFYNFYWVLAVYFPDINTLIIFGCCVLMCVLYAKLFNNVSQKLDPKDDVIDFLVQTQAQQIKNVYEENKTNPVNSEEYENDKQFGLVPNKPIYTLARKSVDGEEEYLNKLYTSSGQKLRWNRKGSTYDAAKKCMIDIYDTFTLDGQLYKTIYINMYGATASSKAPEGFSFTGLTATQESSDPKMIVSEPTNISEKTNVMVELNPEPFQSNPEPKSSTTPYLYLARKNKRNFIITLSILIVYFVISMVVIVSAVMEIHSSNEWYSQLRKDYNEANSTKDYVIEEYDKLVDRYNEVIEDHNGLVDEYNNLLEKYNNLSEKKITAEHFKTLKYSGNGSKSIKGIDLPEGDFYITFKYSGKRYYSIEMQKTAVPSPGSYVNIGYGTGPAELTAGIEGPVAGGYINIDGADGDWEVIIEIVK